MNATGRRADAASPIDAAFSACRGRGEIALIPYLTGGFPTLREFAGHLEAVGAAGADVIEVGIPFCDPIADGPTIQYSSQVALAAGARLPAIFETLKSVKVAQPLVFMSYLNPLLAYGLPRLLADMRAVGASGLIVADLPVEESGEVLAETRAAGVDLIFLAAPTSPDARLAAIAERASGFVYAVSRTGTTGVRAEVEAGLDALLSRLRAVVQAPVAVGFGISTAAHVRDLRGRSDGAIVGSRLVDAIRNGEDIGQVVAELKAATRA